MEIQLTLTYQKNYLKCKFKKWPDIQNTIVNLSKLEHLLRPASIETQTVQSANLISITSILKRLLKLVLKKATISNEI